LEELMPHLQQKFHKLLNIYRSEPFFLEIMPQNIDKAYSLQKLLNSIGLTADSMICCGDGFNDISMIEYAGLGVAMENAQPIVKETADFITKSNDEDGILHVINTFLR
jgi:Cof subfamily protein (haloacid dehalogenase superfamily)